MSRRRKNCALQFGASTLFYDNVKISKKKPDTVWGTLISRSQFCSKQFYKDAEGKTQREDWMDGTNSYSQSIFESTLSLSLYRYRALYGMVEM